MENIFALTMGMATALLALLGYMATEAGFARAKNTGSVMIKALTGFCIGVPCFLFAGRYLAFEGEPSARSLLFTALLVSLMTCVFAAAVMGRMRFAAFCVMSVLLSGLLFPLTVRAGTLFAATFGLLDPMGFGLLGLAAGSAGLMGARALGARLGKYTKGGVPHAMPGHNIPLAMCGILLLSLSLTVLAGSWAAAGGGEESTLLRAMESMILCGGVACLTAMVFTWVRYRKPEITMTISGFLTGMIAAFPGCMGLSPAFACLLGFLAGFLTVLVIENMDVHMNVDDPAGLCGITLVGSVLGLLGAGLFREGAGLFAGGGFQALGAAVVAILAVGIASGLLAWFFTMILRWLKLLRLTPAEEIEGCDLSEHGMAGVYHDFALNLDTTDWSGPFGNGEAEEEETELHAPYSYPPVETAGSRPLTKIEIVARKEKLESLKRALNDIGITGMTVFPVAGCGVQKGYNERYRGVPVEIQLRAKIRVEVVVAKVPVAEVVNTARRVLYSGHAGDGKIFIYSLNDVVRVRTGESGYDAMQGASSE